LPTRSYEEAAGWDLYADQIDVWSSQKGWWEPPEDNRIRRGQTVRVKTGVSIAIPNGYAGFLWDRSSIASRGIHRLAGVIDSDYRGEIMTLMILIDKYYEVSSCFQIDKGDKIIQLIIQQIPVTELEIVNELPLSERGIKGFGSSDRK